MAKPLIYTSAGAASEPSSESYGVLEAPEGVLLYLVAAADDAADPGRIHRAASDRIEQSFREQPLDDPRRFLTRLVGDVNAALFAIGRGEENGGLHASVACLFHAEGRVSYVHVGNARLYVLRDGVIQQITQDHTQAQQMVDQALLKPQEARGHPFSKVVLRTLGKKPIIEVTVQGPHPVKEGDHYILCSPGLVEKLRDDEIGNGLVAGDVAEAVNRLCRAAETRGAPGGACAAIRFGEAAPSRVTAYDPLDNITKSLMSAEGRVRAAGPTSNKATVVRLALAAAMLVYITGFAICSPDCSGTPEPPSAPAAAPATPISILPPQSATPAPPPTPEPAEEETAAAPDDAAVPANDGAPDEAGSLGMKRYDRRFWLFDAILAVMFLICVALTYRSCAAKPERPMPVAAVPVPTPTPEPTPVPVDPDPERTMMLAAVTFFESIANGRYEEAAELFQDPEKRGSWSENLTRVARYGNPIAGYEIERYLERDYCKRDLKDETKGRCDFPILLRRRDREVVEWAAIGIDLERADDGRWRFVYYQQDSLDKEAYDKRKAEEERKREAAAEAHRKLAEAKAAAEADDAAP